MKFSTLENNQLYSNITCKILCRCVDPVDVVLCDDATVVDSLGRDEQYAMVGYLVMKDADSAKYVMQASKIVRLMLPQGGMLPVQDTFIEANVLFLSFHNNNTDFFSNLNMEDVPIALNAINTANFKAYCIRQRRNVSKPITKIKAHFLIKHEYFQNLHQILHNVYPVMIQKLFPSVSPSKKKLPMQYVRDYSHMLKLPFIPDKLQLKAISKMLSVSAEAPFLLTGAFGTGKTHVLACAAAAIVNEDTSAKVLITTHHNKSADTFVSKYFGTMESTKTLPPTVAPIRITTKDLNDIMDKPYFIKFNDPIITKELLDERRIVITTFLTALRFAFTEKVPRGYFTHILIDEGAQSREPETIAPLIFADERTKVIIGGDHLQVKFCCTYMYGTKVLKVQMFLIVSILFIHTNLTN